MKRETISTVSKKVDSLDDKINHIEKSLWVEYRNGRDQQMHLSEVATLTLDRVKSVENDIAIIRDLNKVHTIFKKRKFYWVMLIVLIIWFGASVPDVIASIIKLL